MTIIYRIVEGFEGEISGSLVNLETSEIRVFDHTTPTINLIKEQIEAGELESAFNSANIVAHVKEFAQKISDHIYLDAERSVVYFDESPLPEGISRTIFKAAFDGTQMGLKALCAFVERLVKGSTNTSREALFSWVKNRNFMLTEDGCFIGYKGVMVDEHGTPRSITAGPGFVNDNYVEYGHLDNSVGNVISIEREYVEQEPGVGCGPGLHVGTFDYAHSFSGDNGVVVIVKVRPEDVVSVPTDSNFQKLRTCRYEVLGYHNSTEELEDIPVYV